MAPKILLGICMGASSTYFFTITNCTGAVFQASVDRQSTIQRGRSRNMFFFATKVVFFVCGVVFCCCSAQFAWCVQVVMNGVVHAYVSCVRSRLTLCACW